MTHTYVVLKVSRQTYDEINARLAFAGYEHAFKDTGDVDMHGIALNCDEPPATDEVPEIPRFPTMLRKMWSGSEVQRWIDENIK